MQGIFINGKRPTSKKQIKEAVNTISKIGDPAPMTVGAILGLKKPSVEIEATSVFGNEYGGPVENMPVGTITFVGPDPSTKRNFYGTITKSESGKLSVK
jgi:ribosomal protein S7